MERTSAALAFFQAHKDLFQYDKYVSNQSPFQPDSQIKGDSYLEHYQKVDRDRHLVPTLSNLYVSLFHIQPPTLAVTNVAQTISAAPLPKADTLQSPVPILRSTNGLPTIIRPPVEHTTQHTQRQSAICVTNASSGELQSRCSNRVHTSKSLADRSDLLQQQPSPIQLSIEQNPYNLPKLNDLLINQETRAAFTAHKVWNESRKLQNLLGSDCVGRVTAASRNLPLSIRSRLRASANVSKRRERLYTLLCRDYDELNKR